MKNNGFYILGIEGGGTKTTWALLDGKGAVVKEGKTTSGNISHLDEAQLAAMLGAIRNAAGPDVRAIGGAFAGCHLETERRRVDAALRRLWPKVENVIIGEDTLSAFAGAHGRGDGMIVIAGTGSNVQGHKAGRWEKAGGWGCLFADPGSGYDLARRGMEAVYAHYDKTQEITLLGRLFLRRTGQNTMAEMVQALLEKSTKTEVADAVPVVFEAAKGGDLLAKKLVHERAEALADRVLYVAKRLGLKKPNIGLVGSLFEKEPYYFRIFERAVRKRIEAGRIFVSRVPGAVGAAHLVADLPPSVIKAAKPLPDAAPAIPYSKATTEGRNPRSRHLDKKSVAQLVDLFVREEAHVDEALRFARPALTVAAAAVAKALRSGHRLFYVGAGTSGRLGVLDASEMPPTFNVPSDLVQGIIAGGTEALLRSQEGAEDDGLGGAASVRERGVSRGDVVVGITAGGSAPFVRGALQEAKHLGATTFLLTCNPHHEPLRGAKAIVLPTGPELITGSTRLKAGTATKLALNLLSSIGMIRSGRVKDNLMVNVQATNRKLRDRAKRLVMILAGVDEKTAFARLEKTRWDVAKASAK